MSASIVRNQNIRWLVLVIIFAQRSAGATESGGWLTEDLLRRLLDAEGYPVTRDELCVVLDYLLDQHVGCLEKKASGDASDRKYKVRLTARGIRAATREETIRGIGVASED